MHGNLTTMMISTPDSNSTTSAMQLKHMKTIKEN